MTEHQTADNIIESNSIIGQKVESQHLEDNLYGDEKTDTSETVKIQNSPDTEGSCSDLNKSNSGGLHPFVHWAQSQTHISLRIDLIQVDNLDVTIENNGLLLKFSARGRGAHGLQDYYFTLDFHSKVDEKFDCHAIERYVLILIKKANQNSAHHWPRLTKSSSKLPWLRVDFDRYAGSDEDESEGACDDEQVVDPPEQDADNDAELDKNNEEYLNLLNELKQKKLSQASSGERSKQSSQNSSSSSWSRSLNHLFADSNKTNSDIFNPFNKHKTNKSSKNSTNMKYDYRKDDVAVDNSKNTARHALDVKKTYLFLYNLVMFIMFLKVCIVLVIKGISGTMDDDIVRGAAFIVKLLTYAQLLETIHPIFGLVPGGPLMPFTQVIGRIVVNIFLAEDRIRIDSYPYAYYLFIVWSSIEIFRYSFYALRVFKVNIYPLTWCRYTLFLPLYPMGGFCESMVMFSTIKLYEKTGTYSFSLPNSANISFNLPVMLKIYTFLLLGPTIIYLMKYMWSQRSRQLVTEKEKLA